MPADKNIKEGWRGMDPSQGRIFDSVPERNYKAVSERYKKEKEEAKKNKKK